MSSIIVGMGGMQQGSQPGATPAMGRIQWISTAALNAVASEQVPGPDGRAQSPLKMYAKVDHPWPDHHIHLLIWIY